jgi:hypothetical protein
VALRLKKFGDPSFRGRNSIKKITGLYSTSQSDRDLRQGSVSDASWWSGRLQCILNPVPAEGWPLVLFLVSEDRMIK